MSFKDHYYEEVNKFCKLSGIPISGGCINNTDRDKIENFLHMKIKQEKGFTRSLERKNSVSTVMDSMKKMVCDSPIEKYLWDALVHFGLDTKAKMQYEIGKYRIDIAFPDSRLAVECDGAQYHRANQLQLERDQKRDKYLARKGWRTLRFEGIAIRRNIYYCIGEIKKNLI